MRFLVGISFDYISSQIIPLIYIYIYRYTHMVETRGSPGKSVSIYTLQLLIVKVLANPDS
jgi:hypothetical protein